MRMDASVCAERVAKASFGVLGTVDEDHGAHLVPVVFVTDGEQVAIPVDTVKSKTGRALRRVDNLERDPRATLLVDHRDHDWSQLWWVRVALTYQGQSRPALWQDRLGDKYRQYGQTGSISRVLVFDVDGYRGWEA